MARAHVAAGDAFGRQAEVRRLVPAVPLGREPRHDTLEVALQRVRLPPELLPVRVRESRSRLSLELVQREVLRHECQRVIEIGTQIGGALAGYPVDEIERDVVKTDIT